MTQNFKTAPKRKTGVVKTTVLFFAVSFLFFGLTLKAQAATYYVDTTLVGTCAGGAGTSYSITSRNCSASDGTKAYKTIGITISGSRVAQGDTVYIRSGTYAETDASAVLSAGSGSLTITPYNGETVIIDPGTLTNYMWRNPSYNIIIDGGVARSLTFQNSGASLKSVVYLSGGNTTITRTNITDSAIRTTNGWATESGATGSLTMSRNLIHDMAGTTIWATGATASFILNVTSNQVDTVKGFVHIEQSGVTLNEFNNTIVRGTGQVHSISYPSVTINAANNIYVLKTNGYLNHLFTVSYASLGVWNFKNNIVWRESITDWQDYSYIIYSLTYLYNIDKSNKFLDPKFTTYGTGYSDADLTLQNIATNYAAGRGSNSSLPVGGDYAGVSWPSNDNSVGCFINPILNPNPYPTLTDNVAFAGDSIMAGQAASDVAHRAYSQFSNLFGLTTINDASNGLAAISGQQIEGSQWLIDRTIFEGAPKTVFISIGINNMNNGTPTSATNAERAQGVKVLFDKLIEAGITPVWLGVESKIGNPPDNTLPVDFNNEVNQICNTENMSCGSILNQMIDDSNWKTDYYSDLTSNVHPNNAGQLLIANLAEYLYYPKFIIGTDKLDPTGNIKIYYDGKYRYTTATSSSMSADLFITLTGGFNSNDKSELLSISSITWSNTGTYHKAWTESSASTTLTNTIHTVGNLEANKNYDVSVDGELGTNITGTNCTEGVCLSDDQGKITFTYTGLYSAHTFDVSKVEATTGSSLANSSNSNNKSGHRQDISNLIASNITPIATPTSSFGTPEPLAKATFTHNLSLHATGADVHSLQQFLNTNGFIVAPTGAGSPGQETALFGLLTYKSLKAFQASVSLPATGYFGPMTRSYISKNIK